MTRSHDSSGERRVLARGAIGVDPRAAIAKLREFMLPDPALYVAELVRVAVELGAKKIVVDNSARDFSIDFECAASPPSPSALSRLFEQLFANDARALRLLAIATNTALGLSPNFVDIYTSAERKDGAVARVRFVPTAEGEEPAIDGVIEWVAPPAGFTERSLRVHVRERFGTSVLREWFGEPIESKVLRTRCLLVPAAIVRAVDGKDLDRGDPPPALARVSLGDKLRGELALLRAVERELDVIDFYERGVLLSRESLFGGETPMNMRAYLDEAQLPTNVSRSAIDRSGSFGRQLSRALDDARARLIEEAVKNLDAPHGADVAAALRALILRRLGSDWVAVASNPNASREDLFLQAALRAPLIPMVHKPPTSLLELASQKGSRVLLFRGAQLPPKELARWLGHAVHAVDESIAVLLSPLDPSDANVELARAEESHARYQKFLGHKPREPRVSGPSTYAIARVMLGQARREGFESVPSITTGDAAIDGELVIHGPRAGARAMELVIFVEGRPLPATIETDGPLFIQAAVQHSTLVARSDFTGPERNAALNNAVAQIGVAANDALWFVASFLADPKRYDGDPRVHWVCDAAMKMSEAERAAVIERALRVQQLHRSAKAGRARLAELLSESPGIRTAPLFSSTTNKRMSIAELDAISARSDRAILFATERSTVEHPAAPVLFVTEEQRELIAALLPDRELVDYGKYAANAGQSGRESIAKDNVVGPWLSLRGATTEARVAVASRSAQLVATHRGQIVAQSSDYGPIGRCVLVIEDSALVPRVGREFSQASLSSEARAIAAEAQFDLLYAMLRAIAGEREAAMALDVSLPWTPPQQVRSFLFVAAARLRALPPDEARGTDKKVTHKRLLQLCEELPLVPVRTKDGLRSLSLSALRERAKSTGGGALISLESAPDDIDYDESFEPVIVARGEYEAALAVGIGAKLTSADATLATRRDKRKLRLALEGFERKPTTELANLSEFRPIETVQANSEHYQAVLGLLPTPGRARYQVLFRDRVAVSGEVIGTDLLDCPVILRIALTAPEKALSPSLDSLTTPGQSMLTVAMKRALRKLVEEVCKSADGTRDPGASVRALVSTYCADAGRIDDKLRAKVGRAVLWKAVPVGLASAEQCAAHGKGRVLYVSKQFDGWIAPADGETDAIAAYVEPTPDGPKEAKEAAQDARRRLLDTLEFVTTLAPKDATEELERTQRARRLLRSAKENIVLRGAPAHAALACRVEDHEPKLGVGELRVTTSGAPKLTIHLFLHGSPLRIIEAPAPVSLSVAIETSAIGDEQAKSGAFPDAVAQRIVGIARKLVTEAMRKHDELPPWSLTAQRWALLQGPSNIKSLRERRAFVDTMGEPMTLAQLDEQQAKFGNVAYSLDPAGAPLEPLDSGRRVLRLTELEARWITAPRVALDYTDALREEQQALARRRMPPAKTIVVRESAPSTSPTFILNIEKNDYEGEVVLTSTRSAPSAKIFFWQGRRPLGETEVPSPWPALIALEVAELKPNRSETAPVEDSVFHRTRAKASELVRAALDAHFVAPPSALAMVRTNSAGSPSIRGGLTRAVGALWLLSDPLEPGYIEVREPGESTLRPHDTRSATQSMRVHSLPVGGQLWFNWGTDDVVTVAHQIVELVRWAYRSMLGQLVAAKKADNDAVFAHMVYAAAARVIDTDAMKKWAADRTLPDTCTTVAKLEAHLTDGKLLELCPEGDARSAQERFVVQRSNARWFQVLEALALVQAPSSKPAERKTDPPPPPVSASEPAPPPPKIEPPRVTKTAEPPAPKPKAKRRELSLDEHITVVLRALGVVERDLRAVRLDPSLGPGLLVTYDAATAIAVVFTRHPLAAALITGTDIKRAHRVLAMAVLGEMNRAVQRFTDADEMRALQALIEIVAEG